MGEVHLTGAPERAQRLPQEIEHDRQGQLRVLLFLLHTGVGDSVGHGKARAAEGIDPDESALLMKREFIRQASQGMAERRRSDGKVAKIAQVLRQEGRPELQAQGAAAGQFRGHLEHPAVLLQCQLARRIGELSALQLYPFEYFVRVQAEALEELDCPVRGTGTHHGRPRRPMAFNSRDFCYCTQAQDPFVVKRMHRNAK